jgi:hypothetical protein
MKERQAKKKRKKRLYDISLYYGTAELRLRSPYKSKSHIINSYSSSFSTFAAELLRLSYFKGWPWTRALPFLFFAYFIWIKRKPVRFSFTAFRKVLLRIRRDILYVNEPTSRNRNGKSEREKERAKLFGFPPLEKKF